ncbi:MAG: ATP-binding cassette domain-containing protein [Pseudomonadota bacterium]
MDVILSVRDLCKSFGALRAVDGVSFSVAASEIFGIAGPNGSGKSTLFNAITALPFPADSGSVTLLGRDITREAPQEICHLGLARTFQRETAFESLSMRQNLMLGAIYGPGSSRRSDRAARVERAFDLIEMPPSRRESLMSEASVFDRKRVMLASALVMQPKIILLDEPVAGLTRDEIAETVAIVRRVNESGVAIVIVEHVLPALLSLSQRLMVLNNGRLLRQGKPEEILRDQAVIEAYLGKRGVADAAAS